MPEEASRATYRANNISSGASEDVPLHINENLCSASPSVTGGVANSRSRELYGLPSPESLLSLSLSVPGTQSLQPHHARAVEQVVRATQSVPQIPRGFGQATHSFKEGLVGLFAFVAMIRMAMMITNFITQHY
jgi:hypothetical protein